MSNHQYPIEFTCVRDGQRLPGSAQISTGEEAINSLTEAQASQIPQVIADEHGLTNVHTPTSTSSD